MKNLTQYIITLILLLIVGAGGFFAGTKYQQGKTAARFGSRGNLHSTNNILGAKSPNQGTKSPDAREIVVEGENYQFTPETITVKKDEKIRIVFKSTDGIHDFRIDELNIATATVRSGQEDFVEFTPDKTGTFKYYCSVGNHRAMGMEGTMIVE